ncbi:MAG TPA: response regulator [Candidatus Acidoferrales bacterium]|nr:response regulator [Candidatus Acidoferrales bacterium]
MKPILVIEPDAASRRRLCGALEAAGFEASAAAGGQAALRRLRSRKFGVLLAPITMPGVDALEILRRVRHGRRARPKLLLLISNESPEILLRALKAGAFDYVLHPADPKELARVVQNALASGRGVPPVEILSARPDWVELRIPCDLNAAERITRFFGHLQADLPESLRERTAHALRELLHNAIEWGGRLDPGHSVLVSRLRGPRMLLYRIADPGSGFRFEALRHAAIANPTEDPTRHFDVRSRMGMRPGGFGLVMVKQLADELVFNEAQNEVAIVFYLNE